MLFFPEPVVFERLAARFGACAMLLFRSEICDKNYYRELCRFREFTDH